MPVHKCPNGKFRIGSGGCIYDSKEKADSAYKGYLAHKHMNEVKNELRELRKYIAEKKQWIQKLKKKR